MLEFFLRIPRKKIGGSKTVSIDVSSMFHMKHFFKWRDKMKKTTLAEAIASWPRETRGTRRDYLDCIAMRYQLGRDVDARALEAQYRRVWNENSR